MDNFHSITHKYSADESDRNIAHVIREELTNVPIQKQPVHKDTAPDLDAEDSTRAALNSLPMKGSMGIPNNKYIDEDGIHRSGTLLTTVAHIITAVVGSGILALPYAMASLGWVLGIFSFILFAAITVYTSQLLADLYIIDGKRQRTYTQMVETVFGFRGKIAIAIAQQSNLVMTALAYNITAANAFLSIAQSICNQQGTPLNSCWGQYWIFAVIFAAIQLLFSQIPSLEQFWWASFIGAAMSFVYGILALILSWVYFGGNGTAAPNNVGSSVDTMWSVFNGIGSILFAYAFSMILLEIQDTIATKENSTSGPTRIMKKSVNISISFMTVFYMLVAIFGYLSRGNEVNGYILNSFPNAPAWTVQLGNVAVLIHMIPSYQLWSQPHFEWVDIGVADIIKDKENPSFLLRPVPFRLWYRSLYVVLLGFISCLCPWFQVIIGLIGSLGFWPLTIFAPIECWIKVFRPRRAQRVAMQALDVFCLLITLLTLAGSIQLLVVSADTFKPFTT